MKFKSAIYAIAFLWGLSFSSVGLPANANGIASKIKELPERSERECLKAIDEAIAEQGDFYNEIVRGGASRKLFYEDPSGFIDLTCFDNLVIITVYFSEFNTAEAEEAANDILTDIFPKD
ncbi:MAG: hypothetical protein J7647_16020 [Cyanobacteria bacterium SBLK]|nr:hypothetical protein [Cyanobacteria bacterium SBLK]